MIYRKTAWFLENMMISGNPPWFTEILKVFFINHSVNHAGFLASIMFSINHTVFPEIMFSVSLDPISISKKFSALWHKEIIIFSIFKFQSDELDALRRIYEDFLKQEITWKAANNCVHKTNSINFYLCQFLKFWLIIQKVMQTDYILIAFSMLRKKTA